MVKQKQANAVHGNAVLPLLVIFLLLLPGAAVGAMPRERKYDRHVGSMLVVCCLACLPDIHCVADGGIYARVVVSHVGLPFLNSPPLFLYLYLWNSFYVALKRIVPGRNRSRNRRESRGIGASGLF